VLTRLGRSIVRHRKLVVAGTGVFFLVSIVLGGGVASKLISGGFEDPDSESSRAADAIAARFGNQQPDLLLLVRAQTGDVDDPEVAAAGRALTEQLAAEPQVEQAASYWTLDAPPLKGRSGEQALVLAVLRGGEQEELDAAEELSPKYARGTRVIEVEVGGYAEVFRQVNEQIESDLLRAELIAFPITLILLVFVFRSAVAAVLPLLVGGVAIVGTFLVLAILASLTEVSVFALNLTTAMGLGLGIDYSLFIVSRYREELANGRDSQDAAVRTVQTAGKTVAFSALTVCVSLAAMLLFPLTFFRSFAYAGMGVSLIAGIAAVVFLPALLALLGPRVDALRVLRHRAPKPTDQGMWHRVATVVMRRPVPIATAVIAVLLLLGLPFLRIEFGLPDDRVLPAHLSSRQVHDEIRADFGSQEQGAIHVVAVDPGRTGDRDAAVDAYAVRLSRLDGVARVDAVTGSYLDGTRVDVPESVTERFEHPDATWLSVVPAVEPFSPEGEEVAKAVRSADAPFPVLVGGQPAELVDAKASLFGRMPLAFGWIALATFVLLFLMFGSIVVPLKALVLNVLSLSATFGALVWVFQDGHLSGVLDFTPTGTIVASVPVLLFCVAFGLSMDYEVFLLSRIKEEHDRTGDNTQAVAIGLERTGRIVTAAALLISVVFIAFATSGVTFIKIFGFGLALAVLMDAFVIRATLVPAFMRIAGEVNWWAPPFLRRLHDRIGISEVEAVEVVEAVEDEEDDADAHATPLPTR
jgi:RND superfamily putative drug exporter